MPAPLLPIRTECPPGSCICQRQALLQEPSGDMRILLLTREEEKRLLQRLEQITSLADLRHMQQRLWQQLGLRLSVGPGQHEVRSLRGITVLVQEQPGLCRKTRKAIPEAIKKSMEHRPQIAYELLDEGGLFGGA